MEGDTRSVDYSSIPPPGKSTGALVVFTCCACMFAWAVPKKAASAP